MGTYLENIDPALCARYIEFLIEDRKEQSTVFHDWLAELYLRMTVNTQKKSDEGAFDNHGTWSSSIIKRHIFAESRKTWYNKLLHFIDTTNYYSTDRLFGLLPSEGQLKRSRTHKDPVV